MRYSQTLIPTLKEDPGEARVVSHRLMLRAGLIRQLTAGVYTWLPLGWRVLRRVAEIVRQEMDAAGAQEVFMPAVQPAELWQETGRWQHYGKELLRFKDRHDRECCFGPTHEEVITDLARRELHSYKQLPANFYQIQTKFRDEVRPRFGVMRGREFLMKDAYSFHASEGCLDETYQAMARAYGRIFDRCGLAHRAVEADTGSIGGASSHEFHVLAEAGEDGIAACDACGYAANLEKAEAGPSRESPPAPTGAALARVATPGRRTIEEVSGFLNVPAARCIKSLVMETDRGAMLLLLRGDHTMNEIKAKSALGVEWLNPVEEGRVAVLMGAPVGSLGPVASPLPVVADRALEGLAEMVCGANEEGVHLTGVTWGRDLPRSAFADLREVVEGDPCPRCAGGTLRLFRGIEVGHVFKLGSKYSRAMAMTVLDAQGEARTPLMGCYGIGVSRIVAAAIEQHHDAKGIIWPVAIAPFQALVVLLNPNDPQARQVAEGLYAGLKEAKVDLLLDDRDERPGVKFNDAELLGIPLQVVVGGKGLKEGVVELKVRRSGEVSRVPLAEAAAAVQRKLEEMGQEKVLRD